MSELFAHISAETQMVHVTVSMEWKETQHQIFDVGVYIVQ